MDLGLQNFIQATAPRNRSVNNRPVPLAFHEAVMLGLVGGALTRVARNGRPRNVDDLADIARTSIVSGGATLLLDLLRRDLDPGN